VDAHCTRHAAWCEELKIVGHRGVLYIKLRRVAFDLKRTLRKGASDAEDNSKALRDFG
jgi:hypothetical protein